MNERTEYRIDYSPFSIRQYLDTDPNFETLVVNPYQTFYVEQEPSNSDWIDDLAGLTQGYAGIVNKIKSNTSDMIWPAEIPESLQQKGTSQAISMGFYFGGDYLYGLPEREDTLYLKNTPEDSPYELFSLGVETHPTENPQAMYGSVPYITGTSPTSSSAVAWVNAAHTYVSISDAPLTDGGRYASFVSESGAMEFFIFGSQQNND